jgi:signal transduction histidine kinase
MRYDLACELRLATSKFLRSSHNAEREPHPYSGSEKPQMEKIAVKDESALKQAIVNLPTMVMSWWTKPWTVRRSSCASIQKERDTIIALQWLVAIGISYLVFAVEDWNLTDPIAGLLISACLLSAVILQRIPDNIFEKPLIEPGLLILDSLLVVSALILREQTAWDLLLLFFFCVFIAAIGENLMQTAIASVLLSFVFLLFFSPNASEALTISPDMLVRVPFMFGISIFYGYMTGRVRLEKRRMEQMEEAVRSRRQFVCALAHDIKTPLNVIGGYAELLAGEYGGQEDPAERLAYLKRVRENIDRVLKLVTDFLTVSKLETLGVEAARTLVQMNAIAEDVVLQQMVTAREKNINLTLDLDSNLKPIMGDNSQLQRALWNLVGNAVKFTPGDGSISVRSRMVGMNVSIEVADTGPGIPREEIPRLFSEFERLKGSASIEGTGLGLFIVKTIVEAHKGTVAVESEEGAGATFKILLPASKEFSPSLQRAQHSNRFKSERLAERAA